MQRARRLRISGEQDLKSPVQAETVFHIRVYPASCMIRCFQQHVLNALFLQPERARQPGKSRANDDNWRGSHADLNYSTGESSPSRAARTILMGGKPWRIKSLWNF